MDNISKSDVDKIFGKILRDYRVKAGFTQEELAEKIGISLKYISRIENGNNGVKTQTLIKYMNDLGLSPNTLYASFLSNPEVKEDIELYNKISLLPDDKKDFISSVVDLLIKK